MDSQNFHDGAWFFLLHLRRYKTYLEKQTQAFTHTHTHMCTYTSVCVCICWGREEGFVGWAIEKYSCLLVSAPHFGTFVVANCFRLLLSLLLSLHSLLLLRPIS